jgi:hypothetical protein
MCHPPEKEIQMSIRRFTAGYAVVLVIAAVLLATLSMNAYPGYSVSEGSRVPASVYYPLPPGKQAILVSAAREACAREGAPVIDEGAHSPTYLPLPPGKQTTLIEAARQACIEAHLAGPTGE